ncbi:hypothetical protein Tco_0272192 [Tanacetum coccineum]
MRLYLCRKSRIVYRDGMLTKLQRDMAAGKFNDAKREPRATRFPAFKESSKRQTKDRCTRSRAVGTYCGWLMWSWNTVTLDNVCTRQTHGGTRPDEEKQDSTYSIRSTDKVDLEEFDLKSALFSHMNKKKSANKNTTNYRLYHALMEALIADEDAMG